MTEIDKPGIKEILWHKMRSDLQNFIPTFSSNFSILCPSCLRQVNFDDMSIEHILPRQAVDLDPKGARDNISRSQRSGLILLCGKRLIMKGDRFHEGGCNSWKGKHFDKFIREMMSKPVTDIRVTTRHQVSLSIVGYLAMFRAYGYKIALTASGRRMRRQFFHPNDFLRDIPLNCQIILAGDPLSEYEATAQSYWDEPFKITIENGSALVGMRSLAFRVPLSANPNLPSTRFLSYVPPKYRFRPDLLTEFN